MENGESSACRHARVAGQLQCAAMGMNSFGAGPAAGRRAMAVPLL
jgi:hypothetical protein